MLPQFQRVKVFQDGASIEDVAKAARNDFIQGFTTNPTLMAQAGITNYEQAAKALIEMSNGKPLSLEVFSDDFEEMARQARVIEAYGPNVFVKIPVQNTRGDSSAELIRHLSSEGIKLNVTAIFTEKQYDNCLQAVEGGERTILSVFAGRIADTGIDPVPLMSTLSNRTSSFDNVDLLWASPREVLNIYQAEECNCDIITATPSLISKLSLHNKELTDYSRETVKMFFDDAQSQKFSI
jgi:transaldolase